MVMSEPPYNKQGFKVAGNAVSRSAVFFQFDVARPRESKAFFHVNAGSQAGKTVLSMGLDELVDLNWSR